MARPADSTLHATDRIRLPLEFDVKQILAEIDLLELDSFTYYDVLPLRAPAHMVDPARPQPPPVDDYADGSWTEWLDTEILRNAPCLSQLIDYFRNHTKVTLVRLLRLGPGAIVEEHKDPTLGLHIEKSVIRLTLPLQSDKGVEFYLNRIPVPMKPGECWYLRLTDPHSIVNRSEIERINLSIDLVPNAWLRALLTEAEASGQ